MEVTGYKLREALRRQTLRRETAASQFNDSLKKFPDEEKATPDEVIKKVRSAEEAISTLQVAQTRYNLTVRVEVPGFSGQKTLLECIKRIGGLGRIEKTWRSAATAKDRGLYDIEETREPGVVRRKRQISFDEASIRTEQIDSELAVLREVIAVGNAHKVDLEDLDASLFDWRWSGAEPVQGLAPWEDRAQHSIAERLWATSYVGGRSDKRFGGHKLL